MPERVKVPSPDLVKAPDPAMMPPYVKVVPLSVVTVPPEEPILMPRLA